MHTHSVLIKKAVNPELVLDAITPRFPWAKPWVIRVSVGLTEAVSVLLADIEDILGANPALDFLRIIEDPSDDTNELYRRKLRVFIQPRGKKIEARDEAISHAIQHAINASTNICHTCGDWLEIKNIGDENERRLSPFLPKAKPGSQINNKMSVCISCARKAWQEDRQSMVSIMNGMDTNGHADALSDLKIDERFAAPDVPPNETITSFEVGPDEDEFLDKEEQQVTDNVFNTNIAIFSSAEVDKLELDYADAPKDHANRIKGLVKQIRRNTPIKRLAVIPDAWRDYCDNLTQQFPNFEETITYIRNQLALSEAGDSVLRFPPFILVGGPGIGKTEFMLTIASDFNTRLEVIDISCTQTGQVLTGSETYWANTKPGMLFNALVFGEIANPIIMLDEIDKARINDTNNPTSALHQLLEPRQARKFHDLSIPELTIDASHVIWMATANSIESIEKPIIDRFKVFDIKEPSKEQMTRIVANQYRRFLDNHPSGGVFERDMRAEVMNELCNHHPRKVKKLLEQSFGLAAYDRRNYLTIQDILASDAGEKRKAGIGFMCETM